MSGPVAARSARFRNGPLDEAGARRRGGVGWSYGEVGVSAEVADHLLGNAERSLRIHDPGRLSEGAEVNTRDVDVPAGVRAFQGGENLSAEEGTHDADGEEEVAP